MAITIESVTSGTSPFTKPTGLAVGDLMVAVVAGTFQKTCQVPSGWTLQGSNSTQGMAKGILSKVADSSDVSATDFTFQDTNSSHMSGALYRITDYADNSVVTFVEFAGDDNDGDATGTVATSITPLHNSSLLITCYVVDDSTGGSFSGYGLSGIGTESFTERYDGAPQFRCNLAVADTLISGTDALGNATVTKGGALSNDEINISGILIYEKVDGTATPSLLQLTTEFFFTIPQLLLGVATFFTPTAQTLSPKWTNTDKNPATNITNQDKS